MRRFYGRSFGWIALIAAVFIVALVVGVSEYFGSSELGISGVFAGLLTARRATAQQDAASQGKTLPPIDTAAPARTETATFALG
jgi:hypothetical protein